jgi:hypothetical protein
MANLILNLSIFAAYVAISFYSFRLSSQPSGGPCNKPSPIQCAKPLFPSPGARSENKLERYELELWIQEESEATSQRPKLKWKLLSSCSQLSFNVSTDAIDTVYNKHTFGGKSNNCTLAFPTFSRVRYDNDHKNESATILKAMFILKQRHSVPESQGASERYKIITESIFDMTRLVELQRKSQVPHFKYNRQPIVLRLVADQQLYSINAPARSDGLKLKYTREGEQIYHKPTMYVDDVALLHSSQIQLAPPEEQADNPRPPITLTIQLSIISPFRHVFHRQLEVGFSMLENVLEPNELDEIRHMISDEYMYRFILTQIITFVHIYLDYMAFRDEMRFYKGKKSMGGISMSSVIGRFICQLVIFLYLCDGGNTSWLILGSVGSGVAIEFWKTTKFFQLKITRSFPFVSLLNTSGMTTLERDTMNYDSIAQKFLGLILYPLVFGSALYSKKFHVYSSLWSWIISNLANAVYTFGFITLCPQLYVNYRLKSVAHLPWKVFIYKIFNTFVDDVFAFMIQMPLKHKLMTLRDDVVFVIFLIQAYIYRVDKTRTNEFGYAYEDTDDSKQIECDHQGQGSDGKGEHSKVE